MVQYLQGKLTKRKVSITPPSNESSSIYYPAQIIGFILESTRLARGTDENQLMFEGRAISTGGIPPSGSGIAFAPTGVVDGDGNAVATLGADDTLARVCHQW